MAVLRVDTFREVLDPLDQPHAVLGLVSQEQVAAIDFDDIVAEGLDFKLVQERLDAFLGHPGVVVLWPDGHGLFLEGLLVDQVGGGVGSSEYVL